MVLRPRRHNRCVLLFFVSLMMRLPCVGVAFIRAPWREYRIVPIVLLGAHLCLGFDRAYVLAELVILGIVSILIKASIVFIYKLLVAISTTRLFLFLIPFV